MKNKRKYGIAVMIIFLLVVCIAVIMIQYRLRGSVKAIPETDITGAEAVFYYQKDSLWAEDLLGESEYTMKSSGCLITGIAAAMQMSAAGLNPGMDPGELNQYFSENKVYDSQGNTQWDEIGKLDGFSVDVYDSVSVQQIQECLQQGRYPIVRVRMNGYGNFHYVVIVTAQNGMFYCMDPMSQKQELVPLSEFKNRIYAIRCVYPDHN